VPDPLPVSKSEATGTPCRVLAVMPARAPSHGPGSNQNPFRYALTLALLGPDGEPYGATCTLVLDRANVDFLQEQIRRARELVHTLQEQN
jgi:hypothetical protein